MQTHWIASALLVLSASSFASSPDGKALFSENCAVCHGDKGQGGMEGPKLAGDASAWSSKLFARAVLEGIDDQGKKLESAMPHWKDSGLKSDHGKAPSSAEIKAIQKYLKTVK